MTRLPTPRDDARAQRPINAPARPTPNIESLAIAALGGFLLGAAGQNGRTRALTRLAGIALVGVAARPIVSASVRRVGGRRRSVAVHSAVDIERPVQDVFAFFKDFENFPRVIGSVRSVLDYQDGRSHWEAYTSSGGIVAWDAVVTKYVPNSVIAWESVVRSVVESAGVARFTALSPTRTRVDLSLTHRPRHTSLKDAVRALLAPRAASVVRGHLDHIRFYLESLPAPVREETGADGAAR